MDLKRHFTNEKKKKCCSYDSKSVHCFKEFHSNQLRINLEGEEEVSLF